MLVLAGCAELAPRPDLATENALPVGRDGPLDTAIDAAVQRHAGESGFRLLIDGPEAFVARLQGARMAKRSIDVQTYIWHADATGAFLAQVLLESADRGVKVRVLVDDMDARSKNDQIAALAAHPQISVRLFNPFASRQGTLALLGEGIGNFGRINRRMHNKTWIVDGRVAIVGGRNIGDEYFGASDEINFVDLDFLMVGPIAADASASFDRYWNSPSAYPIELLDKESVDPAALEQLRVPLDANSLEVRNSRYAAALRADSTVQQMLAGNLALQWSADYQFVADDPLKVGMTAKDAAQSHVGAALLPMIEGTQNSLTIISPYFVPGERLTASLVALAQAGKQVRILTNSLAANDVAAVHGGYSRYRQALVEGGVQLWELKPIGRGKSESSFTGSSGASLHTKAFAVDATTVFVGSYNLDPRSTWLNCEQGVMVEDGVVAGQLDSIFLIQTAPDRAWRVALVGNELQWNDGTDQFDSDPKASSWRRFQAWFARTFHLDAQL